MASTPVHVIETTGQTLTLELYPENSDTIANGAGDTLTEETNRKGVYVATVTEALQGLYYAVVKDAGTTVQTGLVHLRDDTKIRRVGAASDFDDRRIISVVEHQRGAHTHQPVGNIFYVDPINGDTHANGNRGGIDDPYAGVQDCHDNAITDSNHDMIILLSGASGPTTLSEAVTLGKRYLFIRGPGRDFIWTRPTNGDTITVEADGIELSGFQVGTAATGTGNGITVSSGTDFFRASKLWINDTQGHAIELTDSDNFVIEDCVLQGSGVGGSGHGISVTADNTKDSNYGMIRNNYIHDVQGDGILLNTNGTGVIDATLIEGNMIQGCTGDGIDIMDANCTNTFLWNNFFGNNSESDVEDNGTNTIQVNNEQWATSINLATVDTVVDTILADTNELQTDWADGGRLDTLLDTAGSGATAAGVWTYATRTLTQSVAALASTITGTEVSFHRGDTNVLSVTGLGDISARTDLWFTAKKDKDQADSAAKIQIDTDTGLICLEGVTTGLTAADGAIVVDDESAGDITITLKAASSASLTQLDFGVYDIQMLDSSGVVTTLASGVFKTTLDVTKAVS